MTTAPDIWQAMVYALEHKEVYEDANRRFALAATTLFDDRSHDRIRPSDAGRCVREKWAELHDRFDLPENWETKVAKMEGGSMYGARIAALFAAGYEATHERDVRVLCEIRFDEDGMPGTIDAEIQHFLIETDGAGDDWIPQWIIEAKTSFYPGAFTEPKEYQAIQAGIYAEKRMVKGFSLFHALPAATKWKNKELPEGELLHFRQSDFFVEHWADRIAAEIQRLQGAKADDAPVGDPVEDWRCASCRAGWCKRNVNFASKKELVQRLNIPVGQEAMLG